MRRGAGEQARLALVFLAAASVASRAEGGGRDERRGTTPAGAAGARPPQRLVAQLAGLTPQYYNDIERGRRTPPDATYAALCGVLGLASDRPAALGG